jgi:hypothetical protein
MALTLEDLPFSLKANDIVKHIINIDSRFRLPVMKGDSNDSTFYFNLLAPIRNVLRIRVTSIEFANNYYIFSAYRQNVTILMKGTGGAIRTITIPDGNYLVNDMLDTLNAVIASVPSLAGITVSFADVTGHFTFKGSSQFQICTVTPPGLSMDREYDYGLGYNLGFSRGIFTATGSGTSWEITSNQPAYFAGDPYVFLKVNDYACVRQTVGGNDFTALAKIVMTQAKDFMNYDDYAGQHAKEVVFPSPVDLSRFRVQLLDPYGMPLQMLSTQISFSLEVLEVKNLTLYNTIRDSFAADWVVRESDGKKMSVERRR